MKPARVRIVRPWLRITRSEHAGALPRRMACDVCCIDYLNQGVSTAARFLRAHRRCGFLR